MFSGALAYLVLTPPHAVSALTCALYDHSLTISDELETMWTRKVDLSTVVYFVMRYGIDGVLLYMAYCRYLQIFASSEVLMQLPVVFSGFTTLSQAVSVRIPHALVYNVLTSLP